MVEGVKIPRILIAGTHSGVGKTTITMGIIGALSKKGYKVQPFKVGPDYIDPKFHSLVTEKPSRNLDSYLLDKKTIINLFIKSSNNVDIAVVEGVMGLYDGLGTTSDLASSAHIAKILNIPVVLIVEGKGMSASSAAMVLGYKKYDEKLNLAGVIFNKIMGEKHYNLLKEAVERDTKIPCIGYMPPNNTMNLKSRHLGLIPTIEVDKVKEISDKAVENVKKHIDLDKIIDLANKAPYFKEIFHGEFKTKTKTKPKGKRKKLKIGYPYDKAFNFYYQDNLDYLKDKGIEIIRFSPLKDKKLPDNIHGLYLGGGFPEIYAKQLENNYSIKADILKKAKEGMPIYAECGGFMYLTESIKLNQGEEHEMVGLFEGKTKMTDKLQHFGYCEIRFKENSLILSDIEPIKAHEFHHSLVETDAEKVYEIKKASKTKEATWECGIEKWKSLGGYPHIHFYTNKKFVNRWVELWEEYQRRIM